MRICNATRRTESEKKNFKKQITGTAVGVIVSLVVYFIMQQVVFKVPSIDKRLMEIVNEVNKVCPMMVDSLTRLDNTISVPPKTLQYNYTLGFSKEDVDISILKNHLESNVVNNARTNPDMQYIRNNNVTIQYYYKDYEGNYLFTITVTPKQYK